MTLFYFTREANELFGIGFSQLYCDDSTIRELSKHLRVFQGKVVVTRWGDAVVKKQGVFQRFTLIDDSKPPKIIRQDYTFLFLERFNVGHLLPSVFIDDSGNIVRRVVLNADNLYRIQERFDVIMQGPPS